MNRFPAPWLPRLRHPSARLSLALLVAALTLGSVASLLGPALNWAPIDFCRFHNASKMILAGRSPYGQLPFFTPPWLAFLLSPLLLLPCSSAALAWILANTALIIGSSHGLGTLAVIPRRYRLPIATLTALLPYAFFAYITGQLSIVALASCVLCARGLSTQRHRAVVIGLLLATLKPHIVAVPMLLVLLELVHRKQWSSLLAALSVLLALGALGAMFVPTWPEALLTSWTTGAFYEPRQNLLGLATFGVPAWLTYPFVGYTLLLWWQRRLDLQILGLSAAVNLLLVPYSRSYDCVLLLLPLAAAWRAPPSPQRHIALSLATAAQLLPLVRAVIPQAGLLEALAPALCTLALLLVSRLRWRELRSLP
jgi:hypothetical protein